MGRALTPMLLALIGCSNRVDRTPALRDVGLPPVPALPAELRTFDVGLTPSLESLGLPMPTGCSVKSAHHPDRRALDCAHRFDPWAPEGWVALKDRAIWTKDGLALAQSWQKQGERWVLTQSVHQSMGDQPAASGASSDASSKAPR